MIPLFSEAVQVEPVADGRYAAQLGKDWTIGPKAHGGLLMARSAVKAPAKGGA